MPDLMASAAPGAVARTVDAPLLLALRVVAVLIDATIIGLLLWAIPLRPSSLLIAWTVGLLAVLVYFTIGEWVCGRTAGKFVTGLKIVGEAGQRPSLGQAFVRNLLRLLEVNFIFGGFPAALLVMTTPKHQRLGDILAETYVLRIKDLKAATEAPIRQPLSQPLAEPASAYDAWGEWRE